MTARTAKKKETPPKPSAKASGKVALQKTAAKTKPQPKPPEKPVAKAAPKATAKQPPKTAAKATPAQSTQPARAMPRLVSNRPQGYHLPTGPAETTLPPRVQVLLDKMDIREIVATFARALDRLDDTLLRSVFHPEATLDLGPGIFQGTAGDYVTWVLATLGQAKSTHHLIGQTRIQLENDTAYAESYAQIQIRSDKPTGREDLFMGLRYLDRVERRPSGTAGVWKIAHRKQIIDWVRTQSVSDLFFHQNPDALWSHRTKTDPSAHMAQFPSATPGAGKPPSFTGRRYDPKSFRF